MVRPRKRRCVNFEPNVTYFKPRGVPISDLEQVTIALDELECLRLTNIELLNQTDAAEQLGVHQSTFQRTLTRARKKITEALVYGRAIKIEGGVVKMPNRDGTGHDGKGSRTGRGMGRCRKTDDESIDETRPRRRFRMR